MSRQHGYSLLELMVALAIIGVVTATVIPITDTQLKSSRLKSDADAVRNLVGLAKMRASSRFTRARVRVDLGVNSYVLQVWDKTAGAWVNDGAPAHTSTGVVFGFGTLATRPLDNQVIALSPPCTTGLTAAGAIANTSCINFNSRGLPVDAAGLLYPSHAFYLRNEIGVFATTVTSTPLIRFWSSPNGTAAWRPR
jgi:prepilin-type N-terminal cleavage/methylation domain-containing protein